MLKKSILEVKNVIKSFSVQEGSFPILENINFNINEKEIVSILGRSGSGKSTLLRILSGLISTTYGTVTYKGEIVNSPVKDMTMIFQSFALFPWLNVIENVAIGLEAQGGMDKEEIISRCRKTLDIMGLRSYENSYPRELSGGMKQRVGFARALVMNPKILLMDEAFSALDVLTAKKMQSDILDLWIENKISPDAILMVTHNIEEAVLLSDKIVILSSNPGRVVAEIKVEIEHPRDRLDPEFRKLVDNIYSIITSLSNKTKSDEKDISSPFAFDKLPKASINKMISFLEQINHDDSVTDLSKIADNLNLPIDLFLSITDSLSLLKFIEIDHNSIRISTSGRMFLTGDAGLREKIFKEHIIQFVPSIAYIRRTIKESKSKCFACDKIFNQLKSKYPVADAQAFIDLIIDWSRYGNILKHDAHTKKLLLV